MRIIGKSFWSAWLVYLSLLCHLSIWFVRLQPRKIRVIYNKLKTTMEDRQLQLHPIAVFMQFAVHNASRTVHRYQYKVIPDAVILRKNQNCNPVIRTDWQARTHQQNSRQTSSTKWPVWRRLIQYHQWPRIHQHATTRHHNIHNLRHYTVDRQWPPTVESILQRGIDPTLQST